MLIDSHCHLDFPYLLDQFDDIMARAAEAGVDEMITISTKVSETDRILAVAERAPNIFCTVGVHPHHAEKEGEVLPEQLVELAKHPKVVGIGESGLDYFYDNSPRDVQQIGFRRHMQAAVMADLPIVVHSRDAEEDTARLIKEEGQGGKLRGVLHCFSSGRSLAEAGLEADFYISFSGIVTFKKSEELREILTDVPLDRILIETDAPYLAPEPYRGKKNEPAYVRYTAGVVADVKGLSLEELGRITTENTHRLFSRMTESKSGAAS